jgi:single-strand DNA-binding protein
MASFNRVVLVGNLTRDPELRYIPSGTAVSEIGLAVNDRVKKGDQWVDETTFVDVTLWGRTAEVANEYLSKGSNILIEGRLKLDTWEKDGQKRSKLRVVAEKMQMLGGKGEGGGGGGGPRGAARPAAAGGRKPASNGGDQDSYDDYSSAPTGGFPDDEIPF